MHRDRMIMFGAGVAAFALSLGLVAWCAARSEAAARVSRQGAPLAVVLVPRLQGTELVVVDLSADRVVRRVGLRSLVTDIEADPSTGLVVAAQSGGVGADADDAVSIIDPRSGAVRYVTLPFVDPARVARLGTRAFVLHALAQPAGLAVSVVDLVTGSVVATGHAPDGPGMWVSSAGDLFTSVLATESGSLARLVRLDPTTMKGVPVPLPGFTPRAASDASGALIVFGAGGGRMGGRPYPVALVDPSSGAVLATGTVSLPHGGSCGVAAGDRIVVSDWTGEEPETRRLEVLGRDTLSHLGSITVDGVPCALASDGRSVLVVDRLGGRLLRIDPVSGRVEGSVELGASDLIYSDVVVSRPGRAPSSDVAQGGLEQVSGP